MSNESKECREIKSQLASRTFAVIFDNIHFGREARKKQGKKTGNTVNIDCSIKNERLLELFVRLVTRGHKYHKLYTAVFHEIDAIPNAVSQPSISDRDLNAFNTDDDHMHRYLKVNYKLLERVRLIDHIENIADLMISDFDSDAEGMVKSALDLNMGLLLALFHDIGKFTKLMEARKIELKKGHEERGLEYFEYIVRSIGEDPTKKPYAALHRSLDAHTKKPAGEKPKKDDWTTVLEHFDREARKLEVQKVRELEAKERN